MQLSAAPLAALLQQHRLTSRALALALGLAPSSISHWLRQGRRPRAADTAVVAAWLIAQGVPAEAAWAWDAGQKEAGSGVHSRSGQSSDDDDTEDNTMLMRRQPLGQATRAWFQLTCDPFSRDLERLEDVFEPPDARYVTQSMWSAVRDGGLLAVVGESGAGKTTLLDALEERIVQTAEPVVLVRPAVAGMEASEGRGQVLRVAHLQEALIHALDPAARLRQSPQARAEQLRRALIGAREAGQRVCLAIDEAHAMPQSTLRHLKRLSEIKRGLTRLLSIIILGQPELGVRLSERAPELREVVQRCAVVTLDPLDDRLEAYYQHKLKPAGVDLGAIADRGALDAIRTKLGMGVKNQRSHAYPLAAGNLLAACLNLAADIGQPAPITAATVGRI